MKDEIKEIFNKYGKSHYEDDYSLEFETYIVELKELKTLYNYITNLQEENKIRQQDINNLTYQLAKEKSRNEKAIKCIKDKYYKEEYERKDTFANKLMNILQGSDKDE